MSMFYFTSMFYKLKITGIIGTILMVFRSFLGITSRVIRSVSNILITQIDHKNVKKLMHYFYI